MSMIQKEGYIFSFKPSACKKCPGYCCCGDSGNIWVTQEEIRKISAYLKEKTIDFINNYLVPVDNRLSLKEDYRKEGFVCVFFDSVEKRCWIYPVRPSQCKRYPFWQAFRQNPESVLNYCPGTFLP